MGLNEWEVLGTDTLKEDYIFELVAGTHIGETLENGHYVAYVKREGKSFEANDDRVEVINFGTKRTEMQLRESVYVVLLSRDRNNKTKHHREEAKKVMVHSPTEESENNERSQHTKNIEGKLNEYISNTVGVLKLDWKSIKSTFFGTWKVKNICTLLFAIL